MECRNASHNSSGGESERRRTTRNQRRAQQHTLIEQVLARQEEQHNVLIQRMSLLEGQVSQLSGSMINPFAVWNPNFLPIVPGTPLQFQTAYTGAPSVSQMPSHAPTATVSRSSQSNVCTQCTSKEEHTQNLGKDTCDASTETIYQGPAELKSTGVQCNLSAKRVSQFVQASMGSQNKEVAVQCDRDLTDVGVQSEILLTSFDEAVVHTGGDWAEVGNETIFQIGDVIRLARTCSSYNAPLQLVEDTQGFVDEVDDDGDIHVYFPAFSADKCTEHWIRGRDVVGSHLRRTLCNGLDGCWESTDYSNITVKQGRCSFDGNDEVSNIAEVGGKVFLNGWRAIRISAESVEWVKSGYDNVVWSRNGCAGYDKAVPDSAPNTKGQVKRQRQRQNQQSKKRGSKG